MKRIFIAGLTLLLAGCASYSKHPDFIERHKKIYTAAVVPADVEVYKLNFKGNKDLMNELIPKVENFSQDKVESVFEEKGYYVQKLKLDKEILEKNPNLKTALLNAKNLFNQKIKSIEKGKKKKFTYSLGSDVNYFANMADADVLVFIKQTGYKKTGAKIARDIGKSLLYGASTIALGSLVNVSISEEKSGSIYPNKASIQVAVVDSNTGDILWYNSVTDNPRVDLTNEKSTRSFLGALFTSFPDRIASQRQVAKINLIEETPSSPNDILDSELSLDIPITN